METEFNLDYYTGKYVMACTTEEEANVFMQYLAYNGRLWNNGESYLDMNNFSNLGSNTVYYFNEGQYGSRSHAESTGYNVLFFSDFSFKFLAVDDITQLDAIEIDLREFIEEL